MAFHLLQHYRRKPTEGNLILSGNELGLYLILSRIKNGTVKVEGRHMEWQKLVNFYDVVVIHDGQLESHISYAAYDLVEYEELEANLVVQMDNVDVSAVVRYYINTREA